MVKHKVARFLFNILSKFGANNQIRLAFDIYWTKPSEDGSKQDIYKYEQILFLSPKLITKHEFFI
jgi:hypothetical protein